MFSSELAESQQTETIIHDVDECVTELLIEYGYTWKTVVDEKKYSNVIIGSLYSSRKRIEFNQKQPSSSIKHDF